jgi:putative tryptophan/tyrosine transport system substrate-binding protein
MGAPVLISAPLLACYFEPRPCHAQVKSFGNAMRRRDFISLLGGASLAWPFATLAAGPKRVIGVLMGYREGDSTAQSQLAAFREALTKLGWMEGSNLRIELRWGAGEADKIKRFANDLVKLRPDAILGVTTPVISALAGETQTTPIVFTLVADPIGNGFAASLAHPGGNITGFAAYDPAVAGKWVALLKEIAPKMMRVAILFNPATASPVQLYMPSIQSAASSLSVQASVAPVHARDEIEGVFAAHARNPDDGVIVMPDAFNIANRDLIIALAARYAVPTIYNATFYAESGGLITYGADFLESFRQAAGYIDRILKGAKAAELPIQLPTKFELVINMKTAKALRLDVPLSLQQIADVVIE